MSVYRPGFSERVFEFAFNAEYCVKNKAVLAACPYLPTQQQEKRLGYDVEFVVNQRGGGMSSLFLQHKVSRFVDSRSSSNAHFYDTVGGEYFAFQLDIDQYNLIQHAAAGRRQSIYYCAPAFISREAMDGRFFTQTVVDDSVWIDVAGSGSISDNKSHCVVYNADGSEAWRFSEEPSKAKAVVGEERTHLAKRMNKFNEESVANIYQELFVDLTEWWPDRKRISRKTEIFEGKRMPDELPPYRDINTLSGAIEAVRELAVDYYGVSWLIGVKK